MLLFLKCANPFEVIFNSTEEVLQILVKIGETDWEPVLDRYRTWGSDRFHDQVTFDELQTGPVGQNLMS